MCRLLNFFEMLFRETQKHAAHLQLFCCPMFAMSMLSLCHVSVCLVCLSVCLSVPLSICRWAVSRLIALLPLPPFLLLLAGVIHVARPLLACNCQLERLICLRMQLLSGVVILSPVRPPSWSWSAKCWRFDRYTEKKTEF